MSGRDTYVEDGPSEQERERADDGQYASDVSELVAHMQTMADRWQWPAVLRALARAMETA